LYSLQMASSNLKHTTFNSKDKKDVVTEMRESPRATSRVIGKSLPLMNADITDRKPAVSTRQSGFRQKRLPKLPRLPESESRTKPLTTEAAEEHRGNGA
jgi:hypothetical protein